MVCTSMFITFVCLFFMTNLVLQKMIGDVDSIEVKKECGKMNLKK